MVKSVSVSVSVTHGMAASSSSGSDTGYNTISLSMTTAEYHTSQPSSMCASDNAHRVNIDRV